MVTPRVVRDMRQRFQKFLPIVLIALAVQILAPVGVTWAAAIAASDPLSAAPICHGGFDRPAQQGDHGGGQRAHDGSCSVCCAAQAGASFDTPNATISAAPYRTAAPVVWHDESAELLPLGAGSSAQARAPPLSL
jgi:Protein of unknown function (DUF2946)